MRRLGRTRPIIFSFIVATGITLTLPYFAFGAGRSFGGSGRIRGSTIHRQHSFFPLNRFGSVPFNRFGFPWVGGVVDGEQPVIIIQQFQPAAATDPVEPTKNGVYVQPRWVDGGYGVEVLQPGYWTYPKQAAAR